MSGKEGISKRLYEPKRKQRQDLWKFIKLVAPASKKSNWKAKDTVGAFHEKYKEKFNYSSETSQKILRHMQKHHSEDIGIKQDISEGN